MKNSKNELIDSSIIYSFASSMELISVSKLLLLILVSLTFSYRNTGGSSVQIGLSFPILILYYFIIPTVSMILVNLSFIRYSKCREILNIKYPKRIFVNLTSIIFGIVILILSLVSIFSIFDTSSEISNLIFLLTVFLALINSVFYYFIIETILELIGYLKYKKYLLYSLYFYIGLLISFILFIILLTMSNDINYNKTLLFIIIYLLYSVISLIIEAFLEYKGSNKILKSF